MVGWYALAALLLGYGVGGALGGLLGNTFANLVGIPVVSALFLALSKLKRGLGDKISIIKDPKRAILLDILERSAIQPDFCPWSVFQRSGGVGSHW